MLERIDFPYKDSIFAFIRRWKLPVLAITYVLLYVAMDLMISNLVRYYVLILFLLIGSLYFSWYLGGKETMLYVSFFNIFFAFIFSRLLYDSGVVISGSLFLSRSFIALYIFTLLCMYLMSRKKSPADQERNRQNEIIEKERESRHKLEFLVTTQKIKNDLVGQANMVKDELLLLQGTWRSKIHTIANDLPDEEHQRLYNEIVRPFQENIIEHLRSLEKRLSFDPQPLALKNVCQHLEENLSPMRKKANVILDYSDKGWKSSQGYIYADEFKLWEMVHNIIRNAQNALDRKRLDNMLARDIDNVKSVIKVVFDIKDGNALLSVMDNAGGVSQDMEQKLFSEPVPSLKRQGSQQGQGTLFVKFFAQNMGIDIKVQNIMFFGRKGLRVDLVIPLWSKDIVQEAVQKANSNDF